MPLKNLQNRYHDVWYLPNKNLPLHPYKSQRSQGLNLRDHDRLAGRLISTYGVNI